MPKWLKILLWLVGGFVVLLVAFVLSINTMVRNVLVEKVDNAIANADSIYVSYESLDLDVFTGEIRIKGVVFQTDGLETDSLRAFSRMEIDDVWLTGVNYKSLFVDKEVDLVGLIIDGVSYRGVLDTKAMQANDAADAITEEEREQFEALLREAQKYLRRVTLENLSLRDVRADVRALETGLSLRVASMGVELYGLGYSLVDSIPFYINDSIYDISVRDFTMVMPDSLMNVQVGRLYTVQESRSLVVEDIHYASDTVWRTDRNFHDVRVDTIRLDTIVVPDMRAQRSLSFRDLRIINASYYGCIDETPKGGGKPAEEIDFSKLKVKTSEAQFIAQFQRRQEEMMDDQQKRMLEMVQLWLDEVKLGRLSLENASLCIDSYASDFKLASKDINIAFHDLGYSLTDEVPYHFSDKRYLLAIGQTAITLPDGLMKITSNGFRHANCGAVVIGKTRVWTTADKWRLAHLRGDVSSTWIDITMDTFYTSSISPFSTVRRRKLALDNVTVAVGDMSIFSDNRNLTISEFKMPSKESIMEMMGLFSIHNVNLSLGRMDTEITGHYSGSGHIRLRDAVVSINGEAGFKRLEADDIHVTFPDSPMRLDIGGIHTNHRTRNVVVNNVSFVTDEQVVPGEQFHGVFVDSIVVEGVMLPEFGNTKDIAASCLRIVHPQYTGYVDEHPDQSKQVKDEDLVAYEGEIDRKLKAFNEIQQRNTLRFLQQWLDDASLRRIYIDGGDIDIHSVRSGFSLRTNGFSLHTSGVGFSIDKFIPISFGDSVVDFDPIKNNFKMMGSSVIYYLALRDLHTTLPDSSMFLNVRRVTTDVRGRSLIVSGVEFATDTVVPEGENYHHATLDTVRLDGIILPDFDDLKEASASKLRIINGHYQGIIGGAVAKADSVRTDTLDEQAVAKQERALAIVQNWFDGASLDAVSVENVSADLTDMSSDLDLKVDGFSLGLNDISYSLDRPTSFVFNQKEYSIGVDGVRCLLPDSSLYIEASNLRHADCGPLSLGRTRMHNTVDKWKIAHTKGDVPTTWFSMVLDTFRTSDIDPMKVVSSSYKLRLDSLVAVIDSMYVFRDMRYKPKKPYEMPQPPILRMPQDVVSRFSVKGVDAAVNKLILEFPSTRESVPHLEIDSIDGVVSDLDLREGKDICVDAKALFGGGLAHLNAKIALRPECPWSVTMQARDINVSHMDSMLYPMVGLTLGGKVTDLRAIYSGDSALAKGYFLMAYDSLSGVFHKGSPTPYKFLRDNTKFLTWAARAFLPKNNPSKPGRKPRAYKAKWKNDVWQPSATFMLGPLIKGVIETILPGIYFPQRVSLDKLIIKQELK